MTRLGRTPRPVMIHDPVHGVHHFLLQFVKLVAEPPDLLAEDLVLAAEFPGLVLLPLQVVLEIGLVLRVPQHVVVEHEIRDRALLLGRGLDAGSTLR